MIHKKIIIIKIIIIKVSCYKNCFHSRSVLGLRMAWDILREERERETSRKKKKEHDKWTIYLFFIGHFEIIDCDNEVG